MRRTARGGIDPRAAVDPAARLGPGVSIGPFAIVGPGARLGAGTRIDGGARILGRVSLGPHCWVHTGAVVGGPPQDLKYRGEPARVEVGEGAVFREGATVHGGTAQGKGTTRIGRRCLVMAAAHIAHDCEIGDYVILDNSVLLGGHVRVGDMAVLGGGTGVHQFTTIGRGAFVGGLSRVVRDVPPFLLVEGNPAEVRAVNERGLKRHGFPEPARAALVAAFRLLYRSDLSVAEASRRLEAQRPRPEVRELVAALRASEAGRFGRALEAVRRDRRADPADPRRGAARWWGAAAGDRP